MQFIGMNAKKDQVVRYVYFHELSEDEIKDLKEFMKSKIDEPFLTLMFDGEVNNFMLSSTVHGDNCVNGKYCPFIGGNLETLKECAQYFYEHFHVYDITDSYFTGEQLIFYTLTFQEEFNRKGE